MMARAAVRDVARALGQPYMLGDRIAKLIPFGKQGFSVTIADSLKDVPELSEIYRSDPDAREVLDLAQKIEGNARHVGVHAAGVVIAPSPVSDYVPIQLDPKGGPSGQGKIITQYDMYAVEDAGLLKFDFLGLTNLSILADAVERVRARRRVTLDLDTLPLDDTKTYELLSRGETLGVFQLSGQGMTSYLIELKPSSIHDINAMVALYRPGPMAFIPAYIERKKDPRLVKYLDPRMENILQNSYGVIVYQDDVLQIARELAGYSWLEADKLRKAMGKKIPKEMAAQKEHFTKGCIEHGMKKDAVQKLWEQIETFAAYGFGKAHAASYGNLAYKTAYMKANFPVDYMAALLTADAGDVEKIAEVVGECRRMHIEVLPPSVNESRGAFTVIDDAHIRFGLYSIKNFGQGVADSIMRARDDGGPFTDIADFLARTADRSTKLGAGNTLNKKSLESLIQSGALDAIGERGAFLAALDTLLEFHRSASTGPSNQTMLFAPSSAARKLELPAGHEAPLEEKLRWEKELLGLYVSGHPLDKFKEKFKDPKKTIRHAKEHARGLEAIIAGFVENARINMTKNGERIAFLRLADFSGSIDLTVFPRVFKEYANIMSAGSCIAVKGKISERNGETSFVVEKAKAL
jgi:DNA polymerase-3 subunit alpha